MGNRIFRIAVLLAMFPVLFGWGLGMIIYAYCIRVYKVASGRDVITRCPDCGRDLIREASVHFDDRDVMRCPVHGVKDVVWRKK